MGMGKEGEVVGKVGIMHSADCCCCVVSVILSFIPSLLLLLFTFDERGVAFFLSSSFELFDHYCFVLYLIMFFHLLGVLT